MAETNGLSNLELMRTLDDSWNAQDWDTFEKRHYHRYRRILARPSGSYAGHRQSQGRIGAVFQDVSR